MLSDDKREKFWAWAGIAKFRVGDRVRKPKGYSFDGVIVAVFETLSGEPRVVAELTTPNGRGMLHIFAESQLELMPD